MALTLAVALGVGWLASMPVHAQATPVQTPLPAPPPLPFDDNPDPDQCGIPVPLGDAVFGTVRGWHEGQRVFDEVHLYDSHLRSAVTGLVPDGTRVQALLFQENPTLDYYFVRWTAPDGTIEGWLPDPFFELER